MFGRIVRLGPGGFSLSQRPPAMARGLRACRVGCGLLVYLTAGSVSVAPALAAEPQSWKGSIEVPGSAIEFSVTFTPAAEAGEWKATLTIPMQGLKDGPLQDVTCTEQELKFTLGPPASAVFEITVDSDGQSASGQMQQHGMTFPVKMTRISDEEAKTLGPPRSQTPKPPFPYTTRDVKYENPKGKVTLAGTLTIPEGPGPHPVVLFITGSGPQDRDETIFGHKPFAVIADHLTRARIATLRIDDRGVGGSTGSTAESTPADFADDVLAGIKFLQQQKEIDGKRIALLGHSEGGIIAPLVASRSKDVQAIVLLAGTGLPGGEILTLQAGKLLQAHGVAEEPLKKHLEVHRQLVQLVVRDAPEAEIREKLGELVDSEVGLGGGEPPPGTTTDALIDAQMKMLTSKWMRAFLKHDPRTALRKVTCPVLAINGALDLQVPPKENLPEIEKALKAAGNKDVTVRELPGLNHLFQEAKTGLVQEYLAIEQTISPAALKEIETWLVKQLKVKAK